MHLVLVHVVVLVVVVDVLVLVFVAGSAFALFAASSLLSRLKAYRLDRIRFVAFFVSFFFYF